MPAFFYTAVDASGKQVSGNVIVRNKSEAYRELEARTLIPVSVGLEGDFAGKGKSKAATAKSGPRRLKRAELILFTEELADLLDAGMQLERALKILNERSTSPSIKAVAGVLRDEIREGTRFSKALGRASSTFDELYCSLVAAGEASGSLPEILRRLVVNLKQLSNLQRRTVSAMIYPLTVLLACIVLIFVVSTVLMPSLTKMMQKTGQDLPFVTDLLIRFTDFMSAWWWLILGLMIGSVVAFRLFITSKRGRPWWDEYKMKLPAFGPVIFGRFYAQFCHTMSNLVNNGVPLLNSLKLITRGTQNHFVRNHLETVVLDVGEGSSLARAMSKTEAFPEGLIDRIAIGEQTGELGKAFSKAATKYDEDLDIRISRLTSIVPNVMLCLVAVVVGVVAYSVITTIFGSMSGIRAR
ncbi:MAG: type II secretion system F family protein [Verrucomicrobiales bacterium]|jgi:general secretion pathway protein F/type IV pilus assembly protein PilC|nr:type II secretion system F family protein [Verrucomicrobiales bacterium]